MSTDAPRSDTGRATESQGNEAQGVYSKPVPPAGAYFNENDSFAADWLSNLFPYAHVDRRSIKDVAADDVMGFRRAHFFGGIGGWEYALQLAGWPAERSVWTGSCPCQSLSCAGKRLGEKDERHLWPEFYHLISECRPAIIFGEQVASPDGLEWLDGISLDLEELDYAFGASDLPAASVKAPHQRQRLYWLAYRQKEHEPRWEKRKADSSEICETGKNCCTSSGRIGSIDALEYANVSHENKWTPSCQQPFRHERFGCDAWQRYEIVECADNTRRRIEPGTLPLAHGVPGRLDKIRGYGNAIVPQVAAEFILAAMEAIQ